MADEVRTCVECRGSVSPVIIMDKSPGGLSRLHIGELEYRLTDDRVSFWTGQYPTAGKVRAFMCEGCGRIALYGGKPDA